MWVPYVRLSDIWFTNKSLSFLKKELGVLKREDVCEHLGHGSAMRTGGAMRAGGARRTGGTMRTGGLGDEGHDYLKKLEDYGTDIDLLHIETGRE